MTAQEMAEEIVECVRSRPDATFVEIVNDCGAEAQGDLSLLLTVKQWDGKAGQDNAVLWANVSDLFCDAFSLAGPRLQSCISPQNMVWMCYAMDGAALKMPLVSLNTKKPPLVPSWLPTTFTLKAASAN
jgi:hypothetical protein